MDLGRVVLSVVLIFAGVVTIYPAWVFASVGYYLFVSIPIFLFFGGFGGLYLEYSLEKIVGDR